MQVSLSSAELFDYTDSQLKFYFPDGRGLDASAKGKSVFAEALDRVDECFKHITVRGYSDDGESCFNHLHGDQYSQYLYFLSNSCYHAGIDVSICQKLLNLNRVFNALFVSYKLDLPPHFLFGHAVGTVLGNAQYGDCLVVLQNVTVNTGKDGTDERLPVIGKGAFFGAGSMLIGCEPVGDRVSFGANAFVFNRVVPDDSVVKNDNGAAVICERHRPSCFAQGYFDIEL